MFRGSPERNNRAAQKGMVIGMEKKAQKNRGVISAGETALFCSQVALILQSGIPLHDGISALVGEGESSSVFFQELNDVVQASGSLYEAVKAAGVFPEYMVNMIRIGESSGKLEEVMTSLAAYYEREDNLKTSVRSAVAYPTVLVVMMAVVVGILVAKVLPVFDKVFRELGSQMPAVSVTIMSVGSVIGKCVLVLLALLAVLLAAAAVWSRARGIGGAALLGRFFLTRRLSEKIASGRFASVASMMLSSGCDTDRMLELIPTVLDDENVIRKVEECRSRIGEGSNFAQAVTETGIFSGVYSRMIAVGCATGTLDSVMKKLASLYEEEIDRSLESFVSIIEPVLIAVLSVVIGAVLLSVMLPLMGIMSSIG